MFFAMGGRKKASRNELEPREKGCQSVSILISSSSLRGCCTVVVGHRLYEKLNSAT